MNNSKKPLFDLLILTTKELTETYFNIKNLNKEITSYLEYIETEVEDLKELSEAKEMLDLLKFKGQNNFEYLLKYKKEKPTKAVEKTIYSINELLKEIKQNEKDIQKEKDNLK